ncbi:hypothetical protein PHISCL_03155 [Aspergillus sclerotialis]|uniref:CCHC-type domain-containing protein n=1 Tax=Aspergillus sclerotialis TaxID=2070753 RepID=A0A3A2ZSZ0_9EURO|nr:hypothetical protein PHISCL_03155 [Aspergillus sclerotialis]
MEASQGNCYRCGTSGHTRNACTALRCVECGEFGHVARSCTSTTPLSKQEKAKISKAEHYHAQQQNRKAERQRHKQLGGHDPKVPVVQTTTETSQSDPKKSDRPNQENNGSAKRKRSGSPGGEASKASRKQHQAPKAPRGKADSRPPPAVGDLVKPSRDGPAYAPLNNNNTNHPSGPRPGPGPTNPPQPPRNPPPPKPNGVRPPPPMMRKKKEADPFIRRKPNRR